MIRNYLFMLLLVTSSAVFAADPPVQQLIRLEGTVICTAADETHGLASNIVNGIGVDEDGSHPFEHWAGQGNGSGMWVSTAGGGGSAANNPAGLECSTWLKFQFDKTYSLGVMWLWNHNQWRTDLDETNRGLKSIQIHYTSNGQTWTKLGDYIIPRTVGAQWIAHNFEVDFAGAQASSVLITADKIDGNYGSNYYGMSEVMFGIDGTSYDIYSKHPQEASIPNGDIVATASSNYQATVSASNTINGSLLDLNFREPSNGGWWHTDGSTGPSAADPNNTLPGAAWLRYDFVQPYTLGTMWVWNMNQVVSGGPDLTSRGLKKVYIEYLDDAGTWHRLMDNSTVPEPNYFIFDQSDGASLIDHTSEVNFGGVTATSVVITADLVDGMWGDPSADPYYGLNEVLFGIANTAWTEPGAPEIALPTEDAVHDSRIVATASSSWDGPSPQHTADGAGLNWNTLLHDNHFGAATMWHADGNTNLDSATPNTTVGYEWIRYDFDKSYPLGTLWVWNLNQVGNTARGLKKVYIEYSNDGQNWSKLLDGDNDFFILDQASGENEIQYTSAIDFGGVNASSVVITADATDGHWGGAPYLGLSEVRFGIYGTSYRGHPVLVNGDLDYDFDVDTDDFSSLVTNWSKNNVLPPADGLLIDNFEAYIPIDPNQTDPIADPNIGLQWTPIEVPEIVSNITLLTNSDDAHTGSQAMRWTWQQLTNGTNAEFLCDFSGLTVGDSVDLAEYDQLTLWIYRHDYDHQAITIDLLDEDELVVASFWIALFPDSTSQPVGQWSELILNLDYDSPTLVKTIKFAVSNTVSTNPGTLDIDDIEFINLPGCSAELEGDLNADCKVDIFDFSILASNWLEGTNW